MTKNKTNLRIDRVLFGFLLLIIVMIYQIILLILVYRWEAFKQSFDGRINFAVVLITLLAGFYFLRDKNEEGDEEK